MSNKIKTHAVRQYLIRIQDLDPRMVSNTEWKAARDKINEAVNNPDRVVHNKSDLPQIHIKGKIAAPVGVPAEKQGEYRPYGATDDVKWVPTVYSTETFVDGRYDGSAKQGT